MPAPSPDERDALLAAFREVTERTKAAQIELRGSEGKGGA